jgi:hypothetical protein
LQKLFGRRMLQQFNTSLLHWHGSFPPPLGAMFEQTCPQF